MASRSDVRPFTLLPSRQRDITNCTSDGITVGTRKNQVNASPSLYHGCIAENPGPRPDKTPVKVLDCQDIENVGFFVFFGDALLTLAERGAGFTLLRLKIKRRPKPPVRSSNAGENTIRIPAHTQRFFGEFALAARIAAPIQPVTHRNTSNDFECS